MENVTPYFIDVAAKWQTSELIGRRIFTIWYELNKGNAIIECGRSFNRTHVFCIIKTMRPKTKFTVRFRVGYWYTDACTNFSKYQTVWTKTAGKAFSIQERLPFGIPSGLRTLDALCFVSLIKKEKKCPGHENLKSTMKTGSRGCMRKKVYFSWYLSIGMTIFAIIRMPEI